MSECLKQHSHRQLPTCSPYNLESGDPPYHCPVVGPSGHYWQSRRDPKGTRLVLVGGQEVGVSRQQTAV